jgi:hypothetical protein
MVTEKFNHEFKRIVTNFVGKWICLVGSGYGTPEDIYLEEQLDRRNAAKTQSN